MLERFDTYMSVYSSDANIVTMVPYGSLQDNVECHSKHVL